MLTSSEAVVGCFSPFWCFSTGEITHRREKSNLAPDVCAREQAAVS